MSISQSRDTILSNFAKQGSALLLWLVIPNLLPIKQYAEVAFIGVVLSFCRYSDLGLSSVYAREVPRLHGVNATAEVELWNRTILWFRLIGGALAGIAASFLVQRRFGAWRDGVLVAILPLLGGAIATYLTMAAARRDFRAYRDCEFELSLSRLIAIPLAFALGILGWLIAQGAALAIVVAALGTKWIPKLRAPEWAMTRGHVPDALQLALIALLWSQLLDSACLLAAVHYSLEGIAIYGILVAGAQSLYSLVIAAYLPISVKTLGLFGKSDRAALEYLYEVIDRTTPVVFGLAVIAAEISPWFLGHLFPKYSIDPAMPKLILYGLTTLPFVAGLGTVFVGKRRTLPYLAILVVALSSVVAIEQQLRPELGIEAAAVAQACGGAILTFMMVIGNHLLCGRALSGVRRRIWFALGKLIALWVIYLAVRFALS